VAVKAACFEFVKEQLEPIGGFDTKKMVGSVGFFMGGIMRTPIVKGVFRFRVDQSNQLDYEAKGMEPYRTKPSTKGMPYWEVPVDVLENRGELKIWAEKAIEVAIRNKK
jgi:DNA transformation protein